jgi:hypothetical protein
MDAETIVWTVILFGGTIAIVAWLLYWALHKDREKARGGAAESSDSTD